MFQVYFLHTLNVLSSYVHNYHLESVLGSDFGVSNRVSCGIDNYSTDIAAAVPVQETQRLFCQYWGETLSIDFITACNPWG